MEVFVFTNGRIETVFEFQVAMRIFKYHFQLHLKVRRKFWLGFRAQVSEYLSTSPKAWKGLPVSLALGPGKFPLACGSV